MASLVAAGLLVVGSYLGGHLVSRGAAAIDPSLLSPALGDGHHHDGEVHGHPVSPSQREPEHEHGDTYAR
jgi:hypothetical protein